MHTDLEGPPPEALARVLSDLQESILSAALAAADPEEQRIRLYRPRGAYEGEVKAGRRRFPGDDAVFAVFELLASGIVIYSSDDSYRLTEKGRRIAAKLTVPREAS